MEYNSLFEPLLCIFLSISLGFLLGALAVLTVTIKEHRATEKELDKFRRLYQEKLDEWANKYVDNDEQ